MLEEQNRAGIGNPVDGSELLAAMRLGVEQTYFLNFRGVAIPVRILSVDETNAVRRAGLAEAAKMRWDDVDRNLHTQKLALALATKMDAKSFPALTETALGKLTLDELGYLYEEYLAILAKYNPRVEDMSDAQFNQLKESAKKKTVEWKDLSLSQLRAIFIDWQRLISEQES